MQKDIPILLRFKAKVLLLICHLWAAYKLKVIIFRVSTHLCNIKPQHMTTKRPAVFHHFSRFIIGCFVRLSLHHSSCNIINITIRICLKLFFFTNIVYRYCSQIPAHHDLTNICNLNISHN